MPTVLWEQREMIDLTPLNARIEAAEACAEHFRVRRPYIHVFVDEARALARQATIDERTRCLTLIQRHIGFDSHQQHRHSWHDLQALLEKIRSGEACPPAATRTAAQASARSSARKLGPKRSRDDKNSGRSDGPSEMSSDDTE